MNTEKIMREIKLNLLHDALHPDGVLEIFTNKYLSIVLSEKFDDRTLREHFQELLAIDDNLNCAYVDKLAKIRDYLLEY